MNRSYKSQVNFLVSDEEFYPFGSDIYDLVFSCLRFTFFINSLHWVNDLNTLFKNIKNSLKNEGAFVFAILGGSTLIEYASSCHTSNIDKSVCIFI